MRILLTGAEGMLGGYVAQVFKGAGHTVIETDRKELDITDQNQVIEKIKQLSPDAIINTAAYNFVDKVEEPEFYRVAYAINAEGPRNLAVAAKEIGVPFLHYSTDFVFRGDKPDGYVETDEPSPISKYGETKLAGEKLVQEVGGDYYICRLSKIFGRPGRSENSKVSFVALMLRLAKEKPELSIVNEEVGTPGYCLDIAESTLNLLTSGRESGIYHIVNEGGGVNWYDFADEIFVLSGVMIPRKPVLSSEFPTPAKRPKFAELKNTKLPKLRSRREALMAFFEEMSGVV